MKFYLFLICFLLFGCFSEEEKVGKIDASKSWAELVKEGQSFAEKGFLGANIIKDREKLKISFIHESWMFLVPKDNEKIKPFGSKTTFSVFLVSITPKGIEFKDNIYTRDKLNQFRDLVLKIAKDDLVCFILKIDPVLKKKPLSESWDYLSLLHSLSDDRVAYHRFESEDTDYDPDDDSEEKMVSTEWEASLSWADFLTAIRDNAKKEIHWAEMSKGQEKIKTPLFPVQWADPLDSSPSERSGKTYIVFRVHLRPDGIKEENNLYTKKDLKEFHESITGISGDKKACFLVKVDDALMHTSVLESWDYLLPLYRLSENKVVYYREEAKKPEKNAP